jgi:alanyl-tRNA synthetase
MQTAEIKRRWLDFFKSKDHEVVPSAPLISHDPNLMFVVAGMVPFIPYMTGVEPAPYKRATSVQKCVRTLDIEEVGKTTRHGTFFQMNGNFSFGDYFKKEAITYSWEFLTSSKEDGGLGLEKDKLWVTVYKDDQESEDLWLNHTDVPAERIQKRGMEDNYWSTGQAGPAGPCSEIYFDRGEQYGIEGGPEADEDRYIEIWNLVFMQYQRGDGGGKEDFPILGELPSKNIDTGMGLERVAFLMQDVDNIYEIDQVRPLIEHSEELSGITYGENEDHDVRMRVIADHVRSSLMLMSDGVTPSNEGRGYILRRLLRRVIRSLRLLGVAKPSMAELFETSKNAMVDAYPELSETFKRVQKLAANEETSFLKTLVAGEQLLDMELAELKGDQLSAEVAFKLHDTFGFPIDLTQEIASESGKTVDRAGFDSYMSEQKSRAKADAKSKRSATNDDEFIGNMRSLGETVFTGYEELQSEAQILGVNDIGDGLYEVVLDRTSLYAESGGQDSDAGLILGENVELEVLDVQKPVRGLITHKVKSLVGTPEPGKSVISRVDLQWRLGACQAHSATHVVHAAIRQVLGPDAVQSGSYNRPGYMRLDFNWGEALSKETKSEIEEVSNLAIRSDLAVSAHFMSLPEAKDFGALALFGETYDETVRVIEVGGPWSRELCGGTHVSRSSQIGNVSITGEASVGSNSRRIEANVGIESLRELQKQRDLLKTLAAAFKSNDEELVSRILEQQETLRKTQKELEKAKSELALMMVPELSAKAKDSKLVSVVEVDNADQLRQLSMKASEQLGTKSVVALLANIAGRPLVSAAVGREAQAQHRAGDLVKLAATILGGGGGGKADFAQGGGNDISKIDEAIHALEGEIS